ncbi:MAG: transporter permease [Conexibacter sp.]|nr:transporter permease [Conexibacter sp.]
MSAIQPSPALPVGGPAPSAAVTAAWVRSLRPGVILASLVVLFFVLAAIAPALLAPRDPLAIDLAASLRAPSAGHVLGTDQSGRDVYTRIVHGARQSLLIGVGATALAMAVAIALGFLSGLGGRLVDGLVSRFVEVLFSFPVLMLSLLFVTVFGPSATTEIVAVGISSAPGYARMIRGQVLSVRGSGYVEAARALGHSYPRVIRRHVFPNAMRPLVVVVTLGVGQSIVWAAGLAFLGLGVAPPAPEWGAMLDAGRNYVTHAWWLEIFPGLAIVLFALSVTTIGRYLQQRLEGGPAR